MAKEKARGKKEIVHGKRKKHLVKEKLLRQKKNARGKKEKGYDKKKHVVKEKLSLQKKITHGEKKKVAAEESNSQKKRKKKTTKGHEKNVSKNKILKKEKKIFCKFV